MKGCVVCVCVKGRDVGTLRCGGMGIFECGGAGVLSPWCSVRAQNHKNGKELVQSLVKPLVDCYFVHSKYLGCWCGGTVCEVNDTETEPLHFAGCLIINRDVTG